ncbi:uncharacterized protein misp [Hippocampus comes]|uniref:uncharacterized protein misp n=1 Tax=Hippocampus comes TaxID=109280 RepID=UPI00094E2B02|nr:PREDICTED: uncharacterized protein LOC109506815 [Hippocampus comes]
MDDASRRWVLKSLSPPLHPRDLRSATGPSGGEDDGPGGSSGSRDGFYCFAEDPMSPEAELNEARMLSPQRQLRLTTLKEDGAFQVRSYASGQKTQSLFRDSDSPYRVQAGGRRGAFGEEDEKRLRKEIIQKQAPKRKATFKLGEGRDRSGPTNAPTEGSGPVTPTDPGPIDGARIDFGAARQRFLDLERGRRDVLARPRSVGGEDAFDDGVPQTTGKAESDDRDETPIEKDIRLVGEREENLRRARGLKRADGFSEPVEIQSGRARWLPSPREAQKKSRGSFALQLQSHENDVSRKAPRELGDPREQVREDQEVLWPPCCPHRHSRETSSAPPPSTPPRHVPSRTATVSWRSKRESAGLQRRKKSASDFIEKEIEEALLRERELRESRRSREPGERGGSGQSAGESGLRSATPSAERPSKVTAAQVEPIERSGTSQSLLSPFHEFLHDQRKGFHRGHDTSFRAPTFARLIGVARVTATLIVSPPSEGPTGAPPRDSDERRERRKAEDGSYAGIRSVDDINNQVVESTRVIRHKSQRALRWEAGVFADRPRH